jgi:thiol-disulfide isomerase/thioredoxin
LSFQQASAQDIKPLGIGHRVQFEEYIIKDYDNKAYDLKQMVGRQPTLIIFSCNTCPYVIKGQPRINKALELATQLGVSALVVNSNEAKRDEDDSRSAMRAYAKKTFGTKIPYLVDDNAELADFFGATRTPEAFLLNEQGEIVYHGALEDNPSNPKESTIYYLENALNNLKEGKEIEPKETKSIGCTIKRKSK